MPNLNRALRRRKPNNPHLPENPHRVVQYSVADGRDAVGIIEISGNYFLAYDADGGIIGRFHHLMAAVRALPPVSGRSA
jgi:hypothetical protein